MNTQNTMPVAQTILAQLGGAAKLKVMAGAKDFIGGSHSLTFKVGRNNKKVKAVCITLDATDTYSVSVFNAAYEETHVASDVYADSLRRVVESATGLYLSL